MDRIHQNDRVRSFLDDLAGIILGRGPRIQAHGPDLPLQPLDERRAEPVIAPQRVPDPNENDLALK